MTPSHKPKRWFSLSSAGFMLAAGTIMLLQASCAIVSGDDTKPTPTSTPLPTSTPGPLDSALNQVATVTSGVQSGVATVVSNVQSGVATRVSGIVTQLPEAVSTVVSALATLVPAPIATALSSSGGGSNSVTASLSAACSVRNGQAAARLTAAARATGTTIRRVQLFTDGASTYDSGDLSSSAMSTFERAIDVQVSGGQVPLRLRVDATDGSVAERTGTITTTGGGCSVQIR